MAGEHQTSSTHISIHMTHDDGFSWAWAIIEATSFPFDKYIQIFRENVMSSHETQCRRESVSLCGVLLVKRIINYEITSARYPRTKQTWQKINRQILLSCELNTSLLKPEKSVFLMKIIILRRAKWENRRVNWRRAGERRVSGNFLIFYGNYMKIKRFEEHKYQFSLTRQSWKKENQLSATHTF